jgi:hypothetical protein
MQLCWTVVSVIFLLMSDNMYDVEHLFVHMSFTTSVVISYHKNKGEKVRPIDKQHEKNQDGLRLLMYPY